MYYVYLLQCKDNSLYCGYTNNLDERIAKHNAGKASKYTRARLPVKLAYSQRFKTQSAAMKQEANIKSWSRKKKLTLLKNVIKAEKCS
jgi:putative endonuclease